MSEEAAIGTSASFLLNNVNSSKNDQILSSSVQHQLASLDFPNSLIFITTIIFLLKRLTALLCQFLSQMPTPAKPQLSQSWEPRTQFKPYT